MSAISYIKEQITEQMQDMSLAFKEAVNLTPILRNIATVRVSELDGTSLKLHAKMKLATSTWMVRRYENDKKWIDGLKDWNEKILERLG